MIDPDFQKNPPLILVVEDNTTTRMMIRSKIEQQGYRVLENTNGEECLETCQKLKPSMILLDGVMPRLDGFSCCAKLQSILGDDCPPILIITALDDSESVDRAFEVGATDYITKPIHWPVLLQRVKRLLQTHWAMKELKRQIEKERLLTEQLEIANQKLKKIASVDELTQIANRRSFDLYLKREWHRMSREKAYLSLMLCDVDFFKLYNDTYGHQAGDRCLQKVASVLKQNAKRPADLVARYGGEEFVLILSRTTAKGAMEIGERIRQQIKELDISHASSHISTVVTISIGIASIVPIPNFPAEKLIAKADEALYWAKEQGRDRVVLNRFTII
ncbi:MAG: PleD family two-component system response regulator [Xenococcaceae cyanobacterium MO_188.B32]|nr:PleD family two-component system response regulator [Xenococcaceae cyanobacterium MO_188.B32]